MKEKTKKLILLITVCILTLLLLFIALKINDKRKGDALSTSDIKSYLTEINYEEISSYTVEQPNAIMYVSNSSDESSRNFEENFVSVIKKFNLENDIVYININNTSLVDPFYQYAPELIFYQNGVVSDIVDCTTLKSSNDIIKVLKERSVIND